METWNQKINETRTHCPVLLSVTWPWANEKEGDGRGKPVVSVSSFPVIVEVEVTGEWYRNVGHLWMEFSRIFMGLPKLSLIEYALQLNFVFHSILLPSFSKDVNPPTQRHSLMHILHTKLPATICSRKPHLHQETIGFFWAKKWHELTYPRAGCDWSEASGDTG